MSTQALHGERAVSGEGGFSLVELLVAMVVTVIVTGAMFGLMTAGQSAFRREPELADRQQNIRIAMDLVSRDVLNAGSGLPATALVFSPLEAGVMLNGSGPAGSIGAAAAALARPPGDSTNSDILEIVAADERCPILTLCTSVPGTAGLFVTMEQIPACRTEMAVLTDNAGVLVQPVDQVVPTGTACAGGSTAINGNIQLFAAVAPWNTDVLATPRFLHPGRVVRYQIAADPTDGTPSLWRSPSGGYGTDGNVQLAPGGAGFPGGFNTWQLIARGIEDLQLEYMDGSGVWQNCPYLAATCTGAPPAPFVLATDAVRQVRVTLSARAAAIPGMQGATTAAGTGAQAIRGQLVSTIMPRAAYVNLMMLGPTAGGLK